MTRVIGMPGFLSGGAVISDVRLTLVDPRSGAKREIEDFGLLKVHAVAANMALGFADSVKAGFLLVNDLRHYLSYVPDGHVGSPSRTAWHWSRRVRHHWNRTVPAAIKERGCELLFMGASVPTHPVMTPSHGFILREPDFVPEPIPHLKARSIGSGADVEPYRPEPEKLGEEPYELLKWDRSEDRCDHSKPPSAKQSNRTALRA